MSQERQRYSGEGGGPSQCLDGYETPEVAHYIHDMLASMESIAMNCEMRMLAAKLASAKIEAQQHF